VTTLPKRKLFMRGAGSSESGHEGEKPWKLIISARHRVHRRLAM
jgi:hypothetical protein